MSYNLISPNNIKNPIQTKNIRGWFEKEIEDLEPKCLREIVLNVFLNYQELCQFSKMPLLLLEGCDRKPEEGERKKYHNFPREVKDWAKKKNVHLDSRTNGPAIAAFELADGLRPFRYGSNNKWHIHHLYSGKFPYFKKTETLHAAKNGLHFTQSAGLIAVHPILDALCDESPAITWFLRYASWDKFGYDPDGVFSDKIDEYGFSISKASQNKIFCSPEHSAYNQAAASC